ncbi:hypothetical protein KP509_06G002300 [Ceratopteris richardii]|uniref:GST N-terminal domain-containing protein n=1 Tax=Ceratopteris richardii TaxID=49495 RepID=A0A8T2ULB4_CERRI|nr:hypothetical protein KP509_06G002300 [Ceratopteris richardii]KAH7434144.1 hypothetical protein KP509_06G002300 [Ceratopteris richardii]
MDQLEIVELGARFMPKMASSDSYTSLPTSTGEARLYVSTSCPYSQRVWIAKNYKGVENMELLSINILDKPKWYIEKISPFGKIPALEHNGKIIVESLDIIKYMDEKFSGPKLFLLDSSKQAMTYDLLRYLDALNNHFFNVLKRKPLNKIQLGKEIGSYFDRLEGYLGKCCKQGPYFLGSISVVDFSYLPFIERYNIILQEIYCYDIFEKRSRLSQWFKICNELDIYTSTKSNPRMVINEMKRVLER